MWQNAKSQIITDNFDSFHYLKCKSQNSVFEENGFGHLDKLKLTNIAKLEGNILRFRQEFETRLTANNTSFNHRDKR